uniref:Right handed beta helix domain-containing protein n=1 Tax=Lepeophtheirus salmonis TaxID=72036 RepID=A0A0K2UCK0_LEPSM
MQKESEKTLDEHYSLVYFLQNQAILHLEPYSKAIQCSSFKEASNITQLKLIAEDRPYFLPDFLDEDNSLIFDEGNDYKIRAKVIVDPHGTKGVNSTKQFVVNDLQTALKIAQDSDVIYLERGDYDCSKKSNKTLQIKKSVSIIGSSKSDVKICGSIVKWESCKKLYLSNLQIEVNGSNLDERAEPVQNGISEDIYLLGGRTEINGCIIESSANTSLYVIGNNENTTELHVTFSIFDGLEECQRMICPKGSRIRMEFENCYASDSLSFITFIDHDDSHQDCSYFFIDSTFSHIQDAIHISPMKTSNFSLNISGCLFELSQWDEEVKSVGVHLESGNGICIKGNVFYLNSLDSSAIYLKDVRYGLIELNHIESTSDAIRTTSIAEGIAVHNFIDEVRLNNNIVNGARIGYHFSSSNIEKGPNLFSLSNCEASFCSVGLLFELKQSQLPRSLCIHSLKLSNSNYGLMMNTEFTHNDESKVQISGSTINDVPIPFLFHKKFIDRVRMIDNSFTHTLDYESMDPADADLRTKMFFYLATVKNLPYRVAFERDDYVIIENERSYIDLVSS